MIAQVMLSIFLLGVVIYAWTEYKRAPLVAFLSATVSIGGMYFVWFPETSTRWAEIAGIGRGADLILYTWSCISLLVILNLHLKLRTQLEMITVLTRTIAIAGTQLDPSEPVKIKS
jgi:small membrane protein